VFVVGVGNSAGQAALHFHRYARLVIIVARGDSLEKSMSSYLIGEIEAHNIDVRLGTQVVGGGGDDRLQWLTLRAPSGDEYTEAADAVFILIGATPNTEWLPAGIDRDQHGFVVTDQPFDTRPPLLFETTLPGAFAVGDVRAGSVKRVASAVGEGSIVIAQVHQYLSQHHAHLAD
jgi:thioredoxin reductase (NADPH)